MARKKSKSKSAAKSRYVFWQTVIMSSLALGGLLLVAVFAGNKIVEAQPKLGPSFRTALLLFVMWLVVSAGVRSIRSLNKKSGFADLLAGGALIGALGSIACFSFARVVSFFAKSSTLASVFDHRNLMFFAGLGVVAALLAAINAQTKNRALGNLLEVLVIVAIILLLIYFA
ncbi:MAG: hypothetical protein GYB31_05195 [Bacteroidetes bacterium]|nr:hypothetical protein [Bacteroidota bacterium]